MREEEMRVWRQVMASAAKLTVAGRISVSFPAVCCTKQDKLNNASGKKILLCDFPHLKQLERHQGDILDLG